MCVSWNQWIDFLTFVTHVLRCGALRPHLQKQSAEQLLPESASTHSNKAPRALAQTQTIYMYVYTYMLHNMYIYIRIYTYIYIYVYRKIYVYMRMHVYLYLSFSLSLSLSLYIYIYEGARTAMCQHRCRRGAWDRPQRVSNSENYKEKTQITKILKM